MVKSDGWIKECTGWKNKEIGHAAGKVLPLTRIFGHMQET